MNQKPTSESLSFRLLPQFMRLLQDKADGEGVSRGEMARKILTDALAETGQHEWRERMEGLAREILRLREDLATAVTALLTRDGAVPLEEAKTWVRKHLLE